MARNERTGLKLALLSLIMIVCAVASLCFGAVSLSPDELIQAALGRGDATNASILRLVRLPRTLGCLLCGAALAVAGVVIQSVLNNPLAAPNIIGVNAGAGLAVALCCAIAPTAVAITPIAAFLGALVSVMVVLLISAKAGAARITLVLAGMAVSAIFNAAIDAVVTFVPDALTGYSDFRIGGVANLTMARIQPAMWIIIPALIIVLFLSRDLDVLLLGTDQARSLGMNAKAMQLIFLTLAAALSGAAVSFAGLVGFVGLIVPHLMRRLVGERSLPLLLGSALGGSALMTGCDLASRLLFAPYELPVGIVLALGGGPFFIWLLLRQRRGRRHD